MFIARFYDSFINTRNGFSCIKYNLYENIVMYSYITYIM